MGICNRHNEGYQRYGKERAEADHNAHRHPQIVVAQNHREHSQRGGERSQEDGPHPALAGQGGRLADTHTFVPPQLFSIVEEYDAVANDDAYQADQSEDSGDAEIQREYPQSEERTFYS